MAPPTALGTRLGTSLGTGLGQDVTRGERILYALSNLVSGNFYQTDVAGGEPGTAATGVAIGLLYRLDAFVSTGGFAMEPFSTINGTSGWYYGSYNDAWGLSCNNGGGFQAVFPSNYWKASDVGRIFAALGWFRVGTGCTGTVNRGALAALTGLGAYNPGGRTAFAARAGASSPAANLSILCGATYRGAAAPSQLACDAWCDEVRRTGDLPATLTGQTFMHKWPDRALLKSLVAPASIPDVVTRATADAMTKNGSPTVVAIDLARDGQRTLGAQGFSATSYYTAGPGKGIIGTPTALTVQAWVQNPLAGGGYAAATLSAGPVSGYVGHQLYQGVNTIGLTLSDASGNAVNTAATMTASEFAKPFLATATWDGSVVRIYVDDVLRATSAPLSGFLPGTALPMYLGHRPLVAGPQPWPGSVYGVQGGDFVATLAEIQACAAETLRTGKLARIPRAPHHWDLTQDFLPSESVTATVKDRAGSDDLTRVGTGLTLAQRTERVWSYESAPIMSGVTGFTTSAYLTKQTPLAGAASGFWKAYLIRLDSVSVASAFRLLGSCAGGGGAWDFLSSGTNANVRFEALDGVGAVKQAPAIPLTSADVGKLLLIMGVHTGTALLSYARGVQIAGSTAITGYTVATGVERIGDTGNPPAGMTIIGDMGGLGVPGLAEYRAACDACVAREDIVAIPGFTDQITSFKAGTLPASVTQTGSLTMSPQYSRAFGW